MKHSHNRGTLVWWYSTFFSPRGVEQALALGDSGACRRGYLLSLTLLIVQIDWMMTDLGLEQD